MAFPSSFSSPVIVLTSSVDGLITAFDPTSGATAARFSGSSSPRKGLALAGNTLIAASHISPETGAGSINLYNWWSHTAFRQLPVPELVGPLAATPDGAYLFAGGVSGLVHALSLPSGDTVRSFRAHKKPISCIQIGADGSLVLVGSEDGSVVVLPIFKLVDSASIGASGDLILHRLVGHKAPVTAMAAGARATAISCSMDGAFMLWSLEEGTRLRTVKFPCAIYAVAIDPTESRFYIGGSDGCVYLGEMNATNSGSVAAAGQSREPMLPWAEQQTGAVVGMAVVDGGRSLVTASEEGRVCVWGVEEGRVTRVLGEGFGRVSDLAVVARGVGEWKRRGGAWEDEGGGGLRLWRTATEAAAGREIPGAEEMLGEAVRDRSKAIDMLESAIRMYEKLLELILKEANGGRNCERVRRGHEKDDYF